MKIKILSFMLALCIILGTACLVACNDDKTDTPDTSASTEETTEGVQTSETTAATTQAETTVAQTTAAPKDDAAQIISNAVSNTFSLKSFDVNYKIDMVTEMPELQTSMAMTMEYGMKVGTVNGKTAANMTVSATILGTTVTSEEYYEDGYAYGVEEGIGYKYKSEDTDVTEHDSMIQSIPEDLLKDVEVVTNADGSKMIELAFTPEKFAEIYKDFIAEMNSDEDIENMTISGQSVRITVNNGYVTEYALSFTMTGVSSDVKTSNEINAIATYTNPGTNAVPTPPMGYKDFQEITE